MDSIKWMRDDLGLSFTDEELKNILSSIRKVFLKRLHISNLEEKTWADFAQKDALLLASYPRQERTVTQPSMRVQRQHASLDHYGIR